MNYLDYYHNHTILITGGMGFIGSNLARRLVDLGARVTLVDSLIPDYGSNRFNDCAASCIGRQRIHRTER